MSAYGSAYYSLSSIENQCCSLQIDKDMIAMRVVERENANPARHSQTLPWLCVFKIGRSAALFQGSRSCRLDERKHGRIIIVAI
jgi:hypothetical protein